MNSYRKKKTEIQHRTGIAVGTGVIAVGIARRVNHRVAFFLAFLFPD